MEMMQSKSKGLYSIFMRRLTEAKTASKKEIIPFPAIFKKICSNFSINKHECWDILFLLKEAELIEIVPCHGVRIN